MDDRHELKIALDDVKMDDTDQLNFLQDRGYVSDNCVDLEDIPDEDWDKLAEKKDEIAREFEEFLGQWTFLW